jgi:hypothetical protein
MGWLWVAIAVLIVAALLFLVARREHRLRGSGSVSDDHKLDAAAKFHGGSGGS